MTSPALALYRFAGAWLLGCGLGLWYEFLRPLRPRFTGASDLLFLAAAFWAWLQLGFGICQGDLRLAYNAGLALGCIFTGSAARPFLGPHFSVFWKFWAAGYWYIRSKMKKITVFSKKCLHLVKNGLQ